MLTSGKSKCINILLGYLGPFETFNEESALVRKSGRKTSPFTVVSVDRCSISSIFSRGEWLNLDLSYNPSKFVTLSNEELVRQYKIDGYNKKFRKYQSRLIGDLKKEIRKC